MKKYTKALLSIIMSFSLLISCVGLNHAYAGVREPAALDDNDELQYEDNELHIENIRENITEDNAFALQDSFETQNSTERLSDGVNGLLNRDILKGDEITYRYKGKDGNIDWTIDYYGVLTLTGNGDYSDVTADGAYPEWYTYRTSVTSAVLQVTGMHSTCKMFAGMTGLSGIEISYFDVSNVTDASHMFDGCSALSSLDFTKLPMMNLVNASYMFNECTNLSDFQFMGWYTNNITDMSYMFAGCRSLSDIDLKLYNTAKVTNMSHMFYNCEGLTSLNINEKGFENFNTSNVTDMSYMFSGCTNLRNFSSTLELNINTANVTNMKCMFENCEVAVIDTSAFDTSNVTDMSGMFTGCRSLNTLSLRNFNTSNVTDMSSMFKGCGFYSFLDLSNFNTSNVTNVSDMFNGFECNILNIANMDTSNVTNMNGMFKDCTLLNFDVKGFNTSKVTDMGEMFRNCVNVSIIDFSSFDTSSLGNVANMFAGCTSLTLITAPANMTRNIDLPVDSNYPWYDSSNKECKYMASGLTSTTSYYRLSAPTVPDTSAPSPTASPTPQPSATPTMNPTASPSASPTISPTASPSTSPTTSPTASPSTSPATSPTTAPTNEPAATPTAEPTASPVPDSEITKGSEWVVDGLKYTVTKNNSTVKTVNFLEVTKNVVNLKIPASVTIGGEKFKVTGITAYALAGNERIANVTIGSNVTKIGKSAFRECPVLQEVKIGKSVQKICAKSFFKSKLLGKITINSQNLTSVGNKAFNKISSENTVYVPKAKYSSYKKLIGKKLNYKKKG